VKTAIGMLTLALAAATPAAAQSIPAVKDAEWCRAFDPKTRDPACINSVSRKPPVPIRPGPSQPAQPATVPPPVLNAASQFDHFALNAVRNTVADVANNLAQSNKTVAARFVMAAKRVGLTPESKVPWQILSDPVAAAPLARAAGIGTDLSDDQWQQAHAIALQASRARQAAAIAAAGQIVPNRGQAAPQPQQAPAPHATVIYCAVVLKPPSEITRDPEYNSNGWLALREEPNRRSKMLHTLRSGDYLYVGSEQCWKGICDTDKREWAHVAGVPRIVGRDAPEKDYTFGWIHRKYIQEFVCPEDQEEQAKQAIKDRPKSNNDAALGETQAPEPQKAKDFPKWLGLGP
jgi:hypothetical protein